MSVELCQIPTHFDLLPFSLLYLSVGNIKSLPNVWKMRLFQVPTSPLERHDTCGTVRLKGDKLSLRNYYWINEMRF